MQSRELIVTRWSWFWMFALIVISTFTVAATVLYFDLGIEPLAYFNLAFENNAAVWWSSILLLLAALHAYDGRRLWRTGQPRAARGWAALSLLLLILSADEVGSLHERVETLLPWSAWQNLLPFVLVLAGLLGYVILALWSAPGQRRQLALVVAGFAMFGVTAVLEIVEATMAWRQVISPGVRAGLEEGAELAGALLLIRAALPNTRGIFAPGGRGRGPVFDAPLARRGAVLVLALAAAPAAAYLSGMWAADGRGRPADWLAVLLFFLTAVATVRPFLRTGERLGAGAWVVTGAALFASAASTSLYAMRPAALLAAALALTAGWLVAPGASRGLPVAAGVLLAIAAAMPLLVPADVVRFLSPVAAGLIAFAAGTRARVGEARQPHARPGAEGSREMAHWQQDAAD